MKKRIFSLLLALAMVLSLMPAGVWAADTEQKFSVDTFDANGEVDNDSTFSRRGLTYEDTDSKEYVSFTDNNFYVIEEDMTFAGDLTIGGEGGLILCQGATLTVEGALIHSGGSRFSIYGKSNGGSDAGELIIQNSKGDGAAIRSTSPYTPQLNIFSGRLKIYGNGQKLIDGVYLESDNSIHMGILDDQVIPPAEWGQTSVSGDELIIEYCDHPDAQYTPSGTTQHIKSCTQCGFNGKVSSLKVADCEFNGAGGVDTGDAAGHYLKCICGNKGTQDEHTSETVPTPDGKKHTTGCDVCGWTASDEGEDHNYDEHGSCTACWITPFLTDSNGNLYNIDDYKKVFEKAADGDISGLQLVCNKNTTDVNEKNIWTKSIEFDYPGKSVTLDMGGITLENGNGAPVITIEAGTLNITGAAVISQTAKSKELVAPAIKVTGGALTFDNIVTATGSAADSSAAPAIEVTGGTVTFEQDVIATAVENEGPYTAIAPAIKVTGGKAVFHGKVTATGGLGGVSKNTRPCEPAIYANGGELEFNGDLDLNGGLTITGDARLTKGLTQGTFRVEYYYKDGEEIKKVSVGNGRAVSVEGSTVYKNSVRGNVNKLLAEGYAFVLSGTDGTASDHYIGGAATEARNATIIAHTHDYDPAENYICVCGATCTHPKYENGKCSVCDKPCPHSGASQSTTNYHWYCDYCGAQVYAYIQNGYVYDFYTTLKDALAAAENGQTVKLVDDIDNSNQDACLTGDGKTVTLNLNGHTIKEGWIYVGISENNQNDQTSSTLKITGTGNYLLSSISGLLDVGYNATLDLSEWTGGTISRIGLRKNGDIQPNPESVLLVGENIGTISDLQIFNWPSSGIKTKLDGGSYGKIQLSLHYNSEPYSSLLAEGYAFQYIDSGEFVGYTETAKSSDGISTLYDVKVVRCTAHVNADNDSLCDYCNTALGDMAASVTPVGTDAKTYYFSDLTAAFNAAADGATVRLLKNVTLSKTLFVDNDNQIAQVTLDLNGFTIDGSKAPDGTTILSFYYGITLTICDSSKAKTGAITNSSNGKSVDPMGTLNITGGNFGNVFLSSTSTVSGGTFASIGCGSNLKLGKQLKEGYAFADSTTNELEDAYSVTFLPNVTVVEHTQHEGSPCGCGYICDHSAGMDPTDGNCKTCDTLLAVASVTAAGEDPAIAYYTDIHAAFNAAATSSDSTLKLLQNVTLDEDDSIYIGSTDYTCTFTVDWNGFTLSGNCYSGLLTFSGHTNVILKDSGNNKGGVRNTHTLESAFSSLSGGIAVCISVDSAYHVTIEGGTYFAKVWKRDCNGTLQISGGVFENPQNSVVNSAISSDRNGAADGKLADLLAEGVTLAYDADGKNLLDVYAPKIAHTEAGKTVYVVPHGHSFNKYGKCACGYTCPHKAIGTDNKCALCHNPMAASVTKGETTTYYLDLSEAITAAYNGGTLKLLADVLDPEQYVSIGSNLTLDLNSFNVSNLQINANITLKDSSTTTKGVIDTLTINSSDTSIVLGDLMTGGDSLKNTTTGWLTPAELLGRTASNVSVVKTEISSVTANGPESVIYGENGNGFIVLTVAPNNLTSYTEHWFELKNGAWTQIARAGGTSYSPADLDAGSHTIRGAVKSTNGWVLSNAVTVTVTPASIAAANITLDHPSFVYDGNIKTPAVSSVTLNLTTLTEDTDYTVAVTGQTNAGSGYTLTVKGEGNYTGEVEVKWSITPKTVTNPTINVAPCVYNGFAQTPRVELKDGSAVIPASEYTVSFSNNTNAGTATVTITDKDGGNYTVSGGTTFKIEKATVTAPAAAELTVYNGLDKTYQVELPALPKLPDGCDYGNTSYGTPTVTMTAEGYYTSGAAVDKDGKLLLLPIKPVATNVEGAIGTVTVKVTTTNYKDITLTVNVSAANKIVPTVDNVSATAITYGQPLSASTITGTMKDGSETVEGIFAWQDGTTLLEAGSRTASWSFTPAKGYEEYAAATGTVTVMVNPKSITDAEITLEENSFIYTGSAQSAIINAVTLNGWTMPITYKVQSGSTATNAGNYTLTIEGEGNYTGTATANWSITAKTVTANVTVNDGPFTYADGAEIRPTVTVKDGDTVIPASEYTVSFSNNTNAGTATVTITDKDGGNYIVSGSTTFEIAKAASSCTAPSANTLTYNGTAQTLLTPGAATGGTMVYRLGENGDFSAQIPSATNAGGYTVYYKVAGDANHNDTDPQSVTVTIGKAAVTITVLDKRAYTDSAAPDLSAPVLGTDYTVEGLLGSDTLRTGPTLAYDPAVPDMRKAGTAAKIVASDADAGENYQFTYVSGTLTLISRANPVGPSEPSVNPGEPDNGSVTVSPKNPAKGSTVIITVEPDEGYELDEITVTDKDGNNLKLTDKGDGKYSFTMPSGKVAIDASFKKLAETSPFDDVSTNAYYYEAVKWAAENSITGGIGNGLFGPELTCTRGQIVTFLWRAAGSPEPTALSSFTDVAADAYYAKAVAWAVENGVTTGTGDGKFSPDAPCTRGQAVTFLWRALGQLTGDKASFSDVPADSYFAQAVAWAAANGVTTGVGNNLFAPGGDCTRAQIVTFLWRAYRQN